MELFFNIVPSGGFGHIDGTQVKAEESLGMILTLCGN